MKTTLKIFLSVCLLSSIVFAEGEMGTGGKKPCPTSTPCLSNVVSGEEVVVKDDKNAEGGDSVFIWLNEVLSEIFS